MRHTHLAVDLRCREVHQDRKTSKSLSHLRPDGKNNNPGSIIRTLHSARAEDSHGDERHEHAIAGDEVECWNMVSACARAREAIYSVQVPVSAPREQLGKYAYQWPAEGSPPEHDVQVELECRAELPQVQPEQNEDQLDEHVFSASRVRNQRGPTRGCAPASRRISSMLFQSGIVGFGGGSLVWARKARSGHATLRRTFILELEYAGAGARVGCHNKCQKRR